MADNIVITVSPSPVLSVNNQVGFVNLTEFEKLLITDGIAQVNDQTKYIRLFDVV